MKVAVDPNVMAVIGVATDPNVMAGIGVTVKSEANEENVYTTRASTSTQMPRSR